MKKISKFTIAVISFVLSVTVCAEENLPILTSKDGCSGGTYVYKEGGKIRPKARFRDPLTHKTVETDFPEALRQECVKDEKTAAYRWENIDKIVDGKVIRAPGNDTFVDSKPIGIPKGMTQEEKLQGIKENRFCTSEGGDVTSIGWVEPSSKGEKFYRCVRVYDENFNVKGTGWVELVIRNGELVTTPI